MSELLYQLDWFRRRMWAKITGRPIYCGRMDGFHYQ